MNKKIIEEVKTSESKISLVLGIVVIAVVGVLLFNYFKGFLNNSKEQLAETGSSSENEVTPSIKTEEKPIFTGELPTKYIVIKNDSLWKISQHFFGTGYNWVNISKENNLANPNVLLEGQELTIPKVESKEPVIAEKTKDEKVGAIEGDKYEIQKDDTLWKISVRAYQDGYKWPEIAKANKLIDPNVIHAGNVLTIPR